MTIQTLPVPQYIDVDLDDLTHLFCTTCDDDVARCGYRTNGWDEVDDDEGKMCRLRAEMEDWPCPRCGTT